MRYTLPTIPTGFEIEPTHGMFSVVFPQGGDNIIKNPSVELNLTGHNAYQSTILRSIDEQRRGAFSIQVSTLTNGTSVNLYGTHYAIDLPGGYFTFSVDIKGIAGYEYATRVSHEPSVALKVAEKKFIANGRWQRVYITFVVTDPGIHYLGIFQTTKLNSIFYTDGYQCENTKIPTSYYDGSMSWFDENELFYHWKGSPHASISHRASYCNSGGIEYSFAELGLHVVSVIGLGMPPVRVIADELSSGEKLYHKSQYTSREFSIIAQLYGKDLNDINKKKKLIESCFRHDNTFPDQQPMVLKYSAYDQDGVTVSDTVTISCLYEGGLEGLLENPFSERFEIRMSMVDQLLMSESEYAKEVGSVSYYGNWSLVKGNWYGLYDNIARVDTGGIEPESISVIKELPNGKIFVGGLFSEVYTKLQTEPYLYDAFLYDPNTNTFQNASIGGNAYINCVHQLSNINLPNKDVIFGANENSIIAGMDAGVKSFINEIWSDLLVSDYPVTNIVRDKAGNYYFSGLFLNIGNTEPMMVACNRIAKYDGDVTPIGTGANNTVETMIINNDILYITGDFTNFNGTTVSKNEIVTVDVSPEGSRNGYVVRKLPPIPTGSLNVEFVKVKIVDGVVFALIQSETQAANYKRVVVYALRGNSWDDVAVLSNYEEPTFYRLESGYSSIHKKDLLYVLGGMLPKINSTEDINKSPVIYLNGGNWIPINCLSTSFAERFTNARDESFYMAMHTYEDIPSLSGCTIRNDSKELAYPKFSISGPGTLWYIETPVTKQMIRFNPYKILNNETVVIDTDPNNTIFYSSVRGNIRKMLYPGSGSVVSFRRGINYITVMLSDNYVKTGANAANITNITLGNVSTKNTDDGTLYLSVIQSGPNYHIELYKNSLRTEIVGTTAVFQTTGTYDIDAFGGSLLTGSIKIATLAPSNNIIIKYGMAIMTWKKKYLSLHEAGTPWQTI
jgi:hypothetical protein